MKKIYSRFFIILITFVSLSSCKKDKDGSPGSQPHPVPSPIDTVAVRLKDFVVSNLPSPYYHFVYNDSGYATEINFASGLHQFTLHYHNRKLVKLVNTPNQDYMVYHYTGNYVTAIDIFSGLNGNKIWHYDLTYNSLNQLVKMETFFVVNGGPQTLAERKVELEYRGDGNLALYKNYRPDANDQLQLSNIISFTGYDNKKNVEDFGLLKDFFEYLIYLPGVKLQKNNPLFMDIASTANDFEISYNYSYDNKNRTVQKITTVRKLRGDNAGTVTTSATNYSYY